MKTRLLQIIVCGLFIVSCSGNATPESTATSVLPLLTTIPSLTPAPTGVLEGPISEIKLEAQTGTAYSLDWSPDGKILVADSAVEITLLSPDLRETFVVLKPEGGALSFIWSPGQKQFASVLGFRNRTITLWDWDSVSYQLTKGQQIDGGSDQYGVSWRPDGKLLATLANDRKGVYQIWDTNTWEEVHRFDLPYTNPRRALNWSADSTTLYDAGETNGEVVIFAFNVTDGTVQ